MAVGAPDVVVVGAGAAGLFCAYFLRRAGCAVTVLERGVVGDPGACSSGNTGFVAQGGVPLAGAWAVARGLRGVLRPDGELNLGWPGAAELAWLRQFRRAGSAEAVAASRAMLVEMKSRSLAILREMATGCLTVSGMITAYRTAAGFAAARRALPRAVDAGVPLRVLDADELRALEPGTEFRVSGAVYNDSGAFLRTPEFLADLAGRVRAMGVQIREHTALEGVDVAGGRIIRLRTADGDVCPQETVIAAGVGSARCARLLGVALPVRPVKGYSITVPMPQGAPTRPVLLAEGTVAVRPCGGQLRIAGGLQLTARRTVSHRRVRAVRDTVRSYLPGMEVPEAEPWTGYRPCTPDSLPLIGRLPGVANAWAACGHGHVGMGLTPVGGRLLAQLLTGAEPELNPAPLDPGRFQ